MRLQLRSSLVKPAKKVIGKQRLTVLVNVSFPAPGSREGKPRLPFFISSCRRRTNGVDVGFTAAR